MAGVLYRAPAGTACTAQLDSPYSAPAGAQVTHTFPSDPLWQVIEYAGGMDRLRTTRPRIGFLIRYVEPTGIKPHGLDPYPLPGTWITNRFEEKFHPTPPGSQITVRMPPAPASHTVRSIIRPSDQVTLPQGFNANEYGAARVDNQREFLLPAGLYATQYGATVIFNSDQYLLPPGYHRATLFGAPDIRNLNRVVEAGSVGNVSRYGTAYLRNRNQHVATTGLQALGLGTPQIRNSLQFVTLAAGIAPRNGYGALTIWNNNPEAYPTGFNSAAYGTASVWNSRKYVAPAAMKSKLAFGPVDIRNLNRFLFLTGIPRATGYGRPDIRNKNRELRPPTLGSFAVVGLHHTWNKTQTAWTAPAARGVAYGTPAILNLNRYYAFESAGDFAALGEPSIWNRNRWLLVAGTAPALSGAPYIWNRNQFVRTSAIVPKVAFGTPGIRNRNQFLRAAGSYMTQFGTTQLTHQHRTIYVAPAQYPPTLPTGHWASTSPQEVAPQLLNSLQMGWQHTVYGKTRTIRAQGFDAVEWGTRIIPPLDEIEVAGWNSLAVALPQKVYSTTRSILPPGFATHEQPWHRWGTYTVWNWRQHVTLYYDPDADTNGERWPLWTKIENRNRVVRTHSTDGAKVSRPEIFLKSRLLFPGGIEAPGWPEFYKAGSVTHWLQRVLPEGLYGRMGTWMIVYYGQGHVRPVPMADFAAVPEPTVVNTRRYYRWVGRIDGAAYGRPFVAYGVRTIACEARFGLEPPLMRLPRIENSDQYVAPVGAEPRGFGRTNLHIHWTTIIPRWQDTPHFGAAKLHNATPEIHTQGRPFERYGRPSVRLQWRPVTQVWSDSFALIGKTLVGYRTRRIEPTTADYLRMGIIADIEGGRREIPTNRTVQPNGISAPLMPSPQMSIWVVRVTQSASTGHRFGTSIRVWANSLYPPSIPWRRYIGEPRVWLGYVPAPEPGEDPDQPPSDDPGEDDDTYVPPPAVSDRRIYGAGGIGTTNIPLGAHNGPRVTPHTIYAPDGDEATAQARTNHPVGDDPKPIIGMAFGTPRFHHWVRYVQMKSADFAIAPPSPKVELRRRYVRPQGWYHGRHGWQWVKGGVQYLEQYDSIGPSTANKRWMGEPGVRDPYEPPPPPVAPAGFSAMRFGNIDNTSGNASNPRARLRVELKNRTLPLPGWDSMVIGRNSYRDDDSFYVDRFRYPMRLTVYFPRPAPMSGFHAAQYGTPWASFRVRDLGVRGFDAGAIDYDSNHFDKRMRVIRTLERETPGSQNVAAEGFDAFMASIVDARPLAHYIRPDGNADQFRKGAF